MNTTQYSQMISKIAYPTHIVSVTNCTDTDLALQKNFPVIIMLSIFVVIGTLGNSIVLFIYGFRFSPSTTRVFIIFLAIFDFITCATLPYKIFLLRNIDVFNNPSYERAEIVRLYFLQVSFMLLPLVSLDRHRRICRPLNIQISITKAKYLIGALCLVLASLNIFRMVVSKPHTCYRAEAYISPEYVAEKFQSGLSHFYFAYMILPYVIPLPILLFCYSLIGIKLRKLSNAQKSRRRQIKVADYDVSILPVQQSPVLGKLNSHSPANRAKREIPQYHVTYETEVTMNPSTSRDAPTTTMLILAPKAIAIFGVPEETIQASPNFSVTSWGKDIRKGQRHKIMLFQRCISRNSNNEKQPHLENTSRSPSKLPLKRMTLIFFLITIIYVIACLPFFTIYIIFRTNYELGHQMLSSSGYIVLYNLVYVPVVSNCFLYGFFDPRFRKELKAVLSSVCERIRASCSRFKLRRFTQEPETMTDTVNECPHYCCVCFRLYK